MAERKSPKQAEEDWRDGAIAGAENWEENFSSKEAKEDWEKGIKEFAGVSPGSLATGRFEDAQRRVTAKTFKDGIEDTKDGDWFKGYVQGITKKK